MLTILALAFLLLAQAPTVPEVTAENAAIAKIGAERNLAAKKKLVLSFEKNFPKSSRLPELYMDLSRTLVSNSDLDTARSYAEKAVAVVAKMKTEAAASGDQTRAQQQWMNSIDTSTKKNLEWVKQMVTWQQEQVRSTVLRKQR